MLNSTVTAQNLGILVTWTSLKGQSATDLQIKITTRVINCINFHLCQLLFLIFPVIAQNSGILVTWTSLKWRSATALITRGMLKVYQLQEFQCTGTRKQIWAKPNSHRTLKCILFLQCVSGKQSQNICISTSVTEIYFNYMETPNIWSSCKEGLHETPLHTFSKRDKQSVLSTNFTGAQSIPSSKYSWKEQNQQVHK